MSAPTLKSTELLTQHLQYPPISLVDDIINTVNDIMYKCTAAMEKYLLKKSQVEGLDYSEEIKVGIAKLESLLEYTVDKNFDKLELYVLRNVLRVPEELIVHDVFRLKHQNELEVVDDKQIKDSEVALNEKIKLIEEKINQNLILKDKIKKIKSTIQKVRKFKKIVIEGLTLKKFDADKELINLLKPIDDTLRLLISQLKNLYTFSEENCSIDEIREITKPEVAQSSNMRVAYIDSNVEKIFETLNLTGNKIQGTKYTSNPIVIKDPDLSVLRE
ncbi:hypothetical protein KAFR_0K00550 [Kazachstania africana CBS 2517]|uniref:Kinetochore-associated protein MTW1 n=1 Tax=Kazachstania africana (strain ATCC 22294 / BCRC 22015 / CBS 2517 / CECT 1963 / NBRC 1671 / NRRL Y-8276) TaxID=1071382 RepID=H2B1B0_KAZAF|nr:hypothetical protein KAFR_0K00550 [Kazachstania africana CBS 2517]CCF60410.1 hypothetical protein KAFR_0K00550 [Kazachstania africana CBS 2517]